MKTAEVYRIADSLNETEQKYWKKEWVASMEQGFSYPEKLTFQAFAMGVYISMDASAALKADRPMIAYGAGNKAKEHLPEIKEQIEVLEIWDAYSTADSLYGILVKRPHKDVPTDTPIVVFLENRAIRREVFSDLETMGFLKLFSYDEFLKMLEAQPYLTEIAEAVTEDTKQKMKEFLHQYAIIENEYAPVNYSVLSKALYSQRLDFGEIDCTSEVLIARLSETLLLENIEKKRLNKVADDLLKADLGNAFHFACAMELFLRSLLTDGIKTRERPIRMTGDRPYDRFAVLEAIRVLLACLCKEEKRKALSAVRFLREQSKDAIPLLAAECFSLLECGELVEALELSRVSMKKEPNDLLANEVFYQVALACKERGIPVEEPLPKYDLNERFCWSGLTFALCYGFDHKDERALFSPCFRTLQCGAYPEGDFWSSEEWREFRKSLLDGSFRYCQKNQCSNIVAGWLPKKSECSHDVVKRLIKGDETLVPPLEELHFSYDFHCNLKCPSCRLEIKTNTKKETEELDELYEKNLKPLVKKAKHLCLSGCGEALLSSHSRKILQSLTKEEYPDLAVELRTNVTSFSPAAWDRLGEGRRAIRHVAASIDAASRELFERLRFPAKWDVVLKNLEFIQLLRNSGEIDLFEFHVVIQTENIEELTAIVKMAMKYDADAVTFSRLVNWRGMSEEEYQAVNPFWTDHPKHERLVQVLEELKNLRSAIDSGEYTGTKGGKKYINIHFIPDLDADYGIIRNGRLKIR